MEPTTLDTRSVPLTASQPLENARLARTYLEHMEQRGCSAETRYAYTGTLQRWLTWLGDTRWEKRTDVAGCGSSAMGIADLQTVLTRTVESSAARPGGGYLWGGGGSVRLGLRRPIWKIVNVPKGASSQDAAPLTVISRR